jgi:hypothetical protein
VAVACSGTSVSQLTGPSETACSVNANAPLQPLAAEGDRVTVSAAASRDCLWTASSQSSWLQVSPANGQGDGTLVIVASANASSDVRIGAILINGVRLAVTQGAPPAPAPVPSGTPPQPTPPPESGQPPTSTPPVSPPAAPAPSPAPAPACTFNVSPLSATFGGDGGAGAIAVTAPSGCAWTATATAGWVDITSGERGSGFGLVRYEVDGHKGKGTRTSTIVVAGITVTITQTGDKN